ncbi:hypothetical protein BV25DRAFT_1829728 [Artomyces pyxidatus]|uniref:Uncharacterized protein n=1 Tax=Artomyces pyxidatus TaxID=48021 RepID=A0ACB8SR87_9AGAM|nr:hypothetical protein BV25DRAFT_1829728 [Artomyces pyxidatus]
MDHATGKARVVQIAGSGVTPSGQPRTLPTASTSTADRSVAGKDSNTEPDYYTAKLGAFQLSRSGLILITTTDASPGRIPSGTQQMRDSYQVQDLDSEGARHWRTIIGRHLAINLFLPTSQRPDPNFVLDVFPQHYSLWLKKRTHEVVRPRRGTSSASQSSSQQQDYFLYGSKEVIRFGSPYEFVRHAEWLMKGKPYGPDGRPKCGCKWCSDLNQMDITKELKAAERQYVEERRIRGLNDNNLYD